MSAQPHVHDHDSADGLLSVDSARTRVLDRVRPLSPLRLPLSDAYGCVVAEDVVAEGDLPEFASSAMDGFAVRASDVEGAGPSRPIELKVVGRALIGQRPEGTVGAGEAIRIATGAPIPAGADCVVPVENAIDDGEEIVRLVQGPSAGTHVRRRGEIDFYKVAMQPGMPQGFGQIEGKPFFGLPGNPVSVFVSLEVFVRPAILKMMGRRQLFRPEVSASLTTEVRGPRGKLQFARVEVHRDGAGWSATPTGGRGSNLMSTVARANGLAMIPEGTESAPAGSSVRVLLFRS